MAPPKCGKCDNQTFQATSISVLGWNFELHAVHCAQCGAVVGIVEDVAAVLKDLRVAR
jgi:hypothetical protein